MRLIHTSDWHIGRSLCGVSLLEDQRHFLKQFTDYLKDKKPDAVLIAGDLYDRPVPSADALELLDEFFSKTVLELKIPVLAIAGNHDSGQRLSYERDFLAKAGLHIGGIPAVPVEKVILTDQNGPVCFYLLPWIDPASVNTLFPDKPRIHTMQEAYNRMAEIIRTDAAPDVRNVLICHGYFGAGTEMSGSEELGGAEQVDLSAFSDFCYIAAGHIHRSFPVAPNVRYSGSVLKYSPKELSNTPGILEVNLDADGNCTCTDMKFSPLHDMRKITGKFADLLTMNGSADYIFAELTDSELILDPARRLKENFPNLMGVSYQERERNNVNFTVETESVSPESLPELFSRFYEFINQETLSPDGLQIVAEAAEYAQKEAEA